MKASEFFLMKPCGDCKAIHFSIFENDPGDGDDAIPQAWVCMSLEQVRELKKQLESSIEKIEADPLLPDTYQLH